MARTNVAVSVTTTATQLTAANAPRASLWIGNNGTVTVFLGDANVTTSTGLPLAAGQTLKDDLAAGSDPNYGNAWYGIVASGTADVRVVEG